MFQALLVAAMDILGARPKGVAGFVCDVVRSHADFYEGDRPLSAEVEAIDGELASERMLGELIALARLRELDDVFALRPIV